MQRGERRPINTFAVVLILVLASAAVIFGIAFLPLRQVDVSKSRNVPYQAGVDAIDLRFTTDVGRVNVAFDDLDDRLVTLDVTVKGRVGVFNSPTIDLTYDDVIVDNALTVTSRLDIILGLVRFWSLNATCDIRVDRSLNTSLTILTSVGGIIMSAPSGVVLNALDLETTTGGIETILAADVVVSGDISITSTTGGAKLDWNRVVSTRDLRVDVTTTTGGVEVSLRQDERLMHNVTLNAEATTGGVALTIAVQGAIGATIESHVTTGGIDINRQVGFGGTASHLSSDNYPARNNFVIDLQTTTGGIDIDAQYAP